MFYLFIFLFMFTVVPTNTSFLSKLLLTLWTLSAIKVLLLLLKKIAGSGWMWSAEDRDGWRSWGSLRTAVDLP